MALSSVSSSYFNQFLNGKPTIAELCEHIRVGTKWYTFGVLLKLDTTELDSIRIMNEDISFKALKMFELWLSSKPRAMRREVIETLQKPAIAENFIAEEYKRALTEIQKEFPRQLLQKHSESLLQFVFPMETVWMLHKEGVISKETLDKIEISEGSLTNDSLRALSNTVSEDPNQLKVFSTVLLQLEDTIHFAKDILKEYNQNFLEVPSLQSQSVTDTTVQISQQVTSTTTQSSVMIHHLSPTYKYDFDQMRAKLGGLILTVLPLIESALTSKLKELKTFLRMSFQELKPQLAIAESFGDVMDIVREKCTIINIACLEAIINHYKIEEAESHITAYKVKVDQFCEEVKIRVCENEDFMTGPSSPLKCQTIEFLLEWNIDEHTLSEIQDLLWKAFGSMAKRVLVRKAEESKSITVTCYAPYNIMDILLMEAEKNLDILIKMGLMKLSISYHIVYDRCTRDKEVRGLMDEVKGLEENLVLQSKALAEKDQQILQLKSSLEVYTSVEREGPQDQSLTDTLSEKMKLLDRMNKAKTLEIEKLTRYKEVTDKVLVEKQEEIEILQKKIKFPRKEELQSLQEIITSLTSQLREKEERNVHLTENIKELRSRILEVRDVLKTSHPLLSQKLEEPLDSKQEDTEAYELVDKMKTLEDLTSTVQEREATDRQQEITKLQEMISSLTLQLTEKDLIITQLTSKDTDEEDSQQESSDDELPRDTRSVKWTTNRVILTSSTVAQCKEVIHQLKRRQHTTWIIELDTLSPQSLLTVLTDINECQVRRLYIRNTHFDINCVSQLSQVVTYNKTMKDLYLYSSPLLPNTYQLLTTALTGNKLIKRLHLWDDTNISDNDIPHFSHLIINNNTLQDLYLTGCPNITKFGIEQLQNVVVKNNSLKRMYVNGNYLR